MELIYTERGSRGILEEEQKLAVLRSLEGRKLDRVLLIPPDFTRYHSGAGQLTCMYYEVLKNRCRVDILPALGTHAPMTRGELDTMYPGIPFEHFFVHNWRTDVVKLGTVSGQKLAELSDGIWTEPVDVEVNGMLVENNYDLIVSIGQVVPHEVIGMSNHSKNIFVGVGGRQMINSSHMLGALYGLERMMGRDHTPVRNLFDYALETFLSGLPLLFVLTTMSAGFHMHGLFIGDTRRTLEEAVKSSQENNIDWVDKGLKKCVVYLDPGEYKSTWLGNKAVYRTRMAIADGGELLVLAPGVERFGEDEGNDRIIRKYGYCGRECILELFRSENDLKENMGAAAHLIHGSPDGRFIVKYAVKNISAEEIRSVGYIPEIYDEAVKKYNPAQMKDGFNIMPDGEEVFYISNPALGLWAEKKRFFETEAQHENSHTWSRSNGNAFRSLPFAGK